MNDSNVPGDTEAACHESDVEAQNLILLLLKTSQNTDKFEQFSQSEFYRTLDLKCIFHTCMPDQSGGSVVKRPRYLRSHLSLSKYFAIGKACYRN